MTKATTNSWVVNITYYWNTPIITSLWACTTPRRRRRFALIAPKYVFMEGIQHGERGEPSRRSSTAFARSPRRVDTSTHRCMIRLPLSTGGTDPVRPSYPSPHFSPHLPCSLVVQVIRRRVSFAVAAALVVRLLLQSFLLTVRWLGMDAPLSFLTRLLVLLLLSTPCVAARQHACGLQTCPSLPPLCVLRMEQDKQ